MPTTLERVIANSEKSIKDAQARKQKHQDAIVECDRVIGFLRKHIADTKSLMAETSEKAEPVTSEPTA